MVKLGLFTPVLTLRRGRHGTWEPDGTIEHIRTVAQAAERLGYEYLACGEHVAIPADRSEEIGSRWWDPLATFGYLAACTSRIRFATLVLVLPYHHPLDIAKRYGTLDRISGGRLVLGVGVGYLEPEFDLLGVPFAGRNDRSDDAIRALRASFGRPEPVYDGSHYHFREMIVDPCAIQQHVTIWIGGQTRRSLRRAIELGDGWCPFGLAPEAAGGWLAEARRTPAWDKREQPLDVALSARIDPLGAPNEAAAAARTLIDAGATALSLRFVHESVAHYVEQLEAMVELVDRL
jgi:probable F420-dependent oxidoreductase